MQLLPAHSSLTALHGFRSTFYTPGSLPGSNNHSTAVAGHPSLVPTSTPKPPQEGAIFLSSDSRDLLLSHRDPRTANESEAADDQPGALWAWGYSPTSLAVPECLTAGQGGQRAAEAAGRWCGQGLPRLAGLCLLPLHTMGVHLGWGHFSGGRDHSRGARKEDPSQGRQASHRQEALEQEITAGTWPKALSPAEGVWADES